MTNVRRLTLSLLAFGAAVLQGGAASALQFKAFDFEAFRAAQVAGHSVLLDIRSGTCERSQAQQKVLQDFASRGRFSEVTVLSIDFEAERDLALIFGASVQSTLVAFDGQKEIVRTVGETDAEIIEIMLRSTMH